MTRAANPPAPTRSPPTDVPRLDVLLARNTRASRKQVRGLFRRAAVCDPEGRPLSDPRQEIAPDGCPLTVLVEGQPVRLHARMDLVLHKPAGVVTALRDASHPTAYGLVRDAPLVDDLRPVGRLDLDTTGLLLWTTQGELLHRLTHPGRAVPRTYQASLDRPHDPMPTPFVLPDGHRPRVKSLRPLAADARHPALASVEGADWHVEIVLTEGRFHEVKRIFAALGSRVVALARTTHGPVSLPEDLAPGAWRRVDPARFAG